MTAAYYFTLPAQDRGLRDGEHIVHLTYLEGCAHCSKEIGNYVLHTAFLIGLTELWHSDSQDFHTVYFFFVIFLRLVFFSIVPK